MTDTPLLETARLRLRPHRIEDFDAYARMWADPAIVRNIGGVPFSREQSWSRFLRQPGLWQLLGFGGFAIVDKATGAYVGDAGFHDMHRDITPSIEGTMEAGWALMPEAQGKGFTEEAMRAALAWADECHPDVRCTAIIGPDNGASLRVAEKLGFKRFAETTYNGADIVLLERRR